ncbi:pathogenesis-related 5 protein Cup a 3-like [Cryptomeria japonica]|uniref:pathogenesis-related 5 protein Cup a 3-like n=1 Tax=Cryptomeria japonica TaxID=3369 RepID=UPI0027DA4167|nr:pathogenesis-related 5 protein Cup a 3-like [Cryptomeria japonica]
MASSIPEHLAFVVIGLCALITGCYCTDFTIQNKCPFPIWPASFNPSSGLELPPGMQTILHVPPQQQAGRIWGRTGCNFSAQGTGSCQTGDCGGQLNCQLTGAVPTSLVEFTLGGSGNQDYYDISLVDGFNLPVGVAPSTSSCQSISCNKNVLADCPAQLKGDGVCKNACLAFPSNDQYCCRGQYVDNCPPNEYSKFFKGECPQAYSYAKDDATSTFVCPTGATYTVTFCP